MDSLLEAVNRGLISSSAFCATRLQITSQLARFFFIRQSTLIELGRHTRVTIDRASGVLQVHVSLVLRADVRTGARRRAHSPKGRRAINRQPRSRQERRVFVLATAALIPCLPVGRDYLCIPCRHHPCPLCRGASPRRRRRQTNPG